MAPTATAERLQEEALRLDREVREHKRQEARHRRRAREKRELFNVLSKKCEELGIELVFEPISQSLRRQSDPSSQETSS